MVNHFQFGFNFAFECNWRRYTKAEAELEHFRSGDGVAYGKAVAAADRAEAATAAAAATAGGAAAAADGGVVARTKGRFW
jgi:hypothetical protein